ncbi:MAG: GWxTD domain-containing protein [Gemmatimonadaceae bacterium]|nr:GWxTD domain-containing protein [Gemmatimonadaceae bacterium]
MPGTPAAIADSLAARGDTAGAVAVLESDVRRNKREAVSWHRLGHLYWEQARAKRRPGYIAELPIIRLLQAADSALRLATQFAPDSARYWLNLGTFNLESGVATMRFASSLQAQEALTSATRTKDVAIMAESEDRLGHGAWRRFEATANRALIDPLNRLQLGAGGAPPVSDPSATLMAQPMGPAGTFNRNLGRDYVMTVMKHLIKPPTGASDLESALAHFRTAVQLNPTSQRYARHFTMALAARKQWEELREFTTQRAREYPFDAESRLTLGLALVRTGHDEQARIVFDSALALLDEPDQARLTGISRILRPGSPRLRAQAGAGMDSLTFKRLSPAQQVTVTRAFWETIDPLASTTENEIQLEVLARIVYADLRWTDEILGYRGADTDRGHVFVRYGPPDLEITMGGNITANYSGGEAGVALVWSYDFGATFFFDLRPGFASANIALHDQPYVESVFEQRPVSMHNVAAARDVDSLPVRSVRFRGPRDSADVVLVASYTPRALLGALEIDPVPMVSLVRATSPLTSSSPTQRAAFELESSTLDSERTQHWRQRVASGISLVRVELSQPDSRRALRATLPVEPDSGRGFGMSDLLLTKQLPVDGPSSSTPPSRWSDLALTPASHHLASGSPIGLVWEVYDLAPGTGTDRAAGNYRVTVRVSAERDALSGTVVRLRDMLGRAIGRTAAADPLSISFDRTAVVQAVSVDYVSLDLGSLPTGRYSLRVHIEDLNTGRTTSRETALDVR